MDRRSFFKIAGLGVFFPSVVTADFGTRGVPKKYRGFNITISKVSDMRWTALGATRQILATNGEYHSSAIFRGESDIRIWNEFRPSLDIAIDRHERKNGS